MTERDKAREEWLKLRRTMLTASDVAAVLGVDDRRGALAVFAEKRGDINAEETFPLRWGRLVEGAICEAYSEETARRTIDYGAHTIQVHPDIPWLGATLDRGVKADLDLQDRVDMDLPPEAEPRPAPASGLGVMDAKAVAGFKARDWEADPPDKYQVQVQVQMACTGRQWGSLCALIAGITIAWRDLTRDDDFLNAAYPELEAFWMRVKRNDPPEADALPGTSRAIRLLWADENKQTVTLDHEALRLMDDLEKVKALVKANEEQEELLQNKLRRLMQDSSYGALPDGSFITLKTTKRAGYTVQPTQYRALRRWWPKLLRKGR